MENKNGIIYPIIGFILDKLFYLNLVELFKYAAKAISNDKISASRMATDIFIILKFVFVITICLCGFNSCVLTFIVWYLIITNLYTYFYYHIWKIDNGFIDENRIKRRFISLFNSFIFSILCFAYLYKIVYFQHYCWENIEPTIINSFFFSIFASFGSYDKIAPIDSCGIIVCGIEFISTFIFATILISGSIPNPLNKK